MDVSAPGATGRWEENRKRTGWGPTVGKTMGSSTMGSGRRKCQGEEGRERTAFTAWQDGKERVRGAFILQLCF